MTGTRRATSRSALVAVPLVAALVAGCSGGPAASTDGARISSSSAAPPTTTAAPTTTAVPSTTTTTAPEEPGWTTLSVGPHGIAVDQRVFPQPDGTQVLVARFLHGHVDYNFHVGSQDPPTGNAAILPDSRPAVSPTEAPLLLACFNGGFKVAAGVGGTQTSGSVLVPLKPGLASLVIDTAGAATVGVWGSTVPTPGEAVASVRQNLPPLVLDGQPSPTVGTWPSWGATLGGVPRVPRSALGEDPAGDLLYAAAPLSLPTDLAAALISAGATTAMELDINPGTVQLDTAATPGAPLVARIPGQNRPADQCRTGWIRDFITVLATG